MTNDKGNPLSEALQESGEWKTMNANAEWIRSGPEHPTIVSKIELAKWVLKQYESCPYEDMETKEVELHVAATEFLIRQLST